MRERNLRSGDVAKAMGLSPATIQSYARNGRIPCRQTPGGQYRFDLDEVRSVLTSPALSPRKGLADLFSTGVAVDSLSAFRGDPVDAAALRRLRIRGVRASGPASAEVGSPAAGSDELAALVKNSTGAVVAVLHRHPVRA